MTAPSPPHIHCTETRPLAPQKLSWREGECQITGNHTWAAAVTGESPAPPIIDKHLCNKFLPVSENQHRPQRREDRAEQGPEVDGHRSVCPSGGPQEPGGVRLLQTAPRVLPAQAVGSREVAVYEEHCQWANKDFPRVLDVRSTKGF